jgi:CheY-like chemotaxis protein
LLDVLICDLAMPQMDGYELWKNVRCLEPEVGWLPVARRFRQAEDKSTSVKRVVVFILLFLFSGRLTRMPIALFTWASQGACPSSGQANA